VGKLGAENSPSLFGAWSAQCETVRTPVKLSMEATMQRLIDDPEATLRRAAEHVLLGYAWFYSDRSVTVPAAATLVRLADEILAERCRWMAILARN
jgi:hypothetical protein